MGVKASPHGITLYFFDKHGNPDHSKPPVSGKLAHLYSIERPVHPGDPNNEYGSGDWLTDVIVADNHVDLKAMPPKQTMQQATSAASKQVLVQWNARDTAGKSSTGKEANQFTIAIGTPPAVPSGDNLLVVDRIDVLPADTVMDPTNKLWQKWCNQKVFIAHLAVALPGEPVPQP